MFKLTGQKNVFSSQPIPPSATTSLGSSQFDKELKLGTGSIDDDGRKRKTPLTTQFDSPTRSNIRVPSQIGIKRRTDIIDIKLGGNQRYDANYQESSQLDLKNICFFLVEKSEPLPPKYQKTLKKWFKLMINEDKMEVQMGQKFEFLTQYSYKKEKHKDSIEKFWLKVIIKFKESHKYCSYSGAIQLLKAHLKENQTYYTTKSQNKTFFDSTVLSPILQDSVIANSSSAKSVVNQEFLVAKICKQLQTDLMVKCQQLVNCYNLLSHKYEIQSILSSPELQQMINSLVCVYRPFQTIVEGAHQEIGSKIIDALFFATLRKQDDGIVIHQIDQANLEFLLSSIDQIIHKMDGNLNKSPSDHNSLSPYSKCIGLINKLLFSRTEIKNKLGPKIIQKIRNLISAELSPLKWILKFQTKFSLGTSFRGSEQPNFVPTGLEWLPFFNNLMDRNQINDGKLLKYNQIFKDFLFYLACSIIEDNPYKFWYESSSYGQIIEYIRGLPRQNSYNKSNNDPRSEVRQNFGRVARLMLCSIGMNGMPKYGPGVRTCKTSNSLDSYSVNFILEDQKKKNEENSILINFLFKHFNRNILNFNQQISIFSSVFLREVLLFTIENNFSYLYTPYIPSSSQKQPAQIEYCSHLYFNSNELLIKVITGSPWLLSQLVSQWNKNKTSLQKSQLTEIQVLYKLSFNLLINMAEYETYVEKSGTPMFLAINLFPHVIELFNSLLVNEATHTVCLELLSHPSIIQNPLIPAMLSEKLKIEDNFLVFTRHIQLIYELGLTSVVWNKNIAMPALSCQAHNFEVHTAKYMANTVRQLLQKLLKKENTSTHSEGQLISQSMSVKNNGQVKIIEELTSNCKYLIEFIKWSLRAKSNPFEPLQFKNCLFQSQNYEPLLAALKLLSVFSDIFNSNIKNILYIPESLKKFLIDFQEHDLNHQKNLDISDFIKIDENKYASLPAALIYLINTTAYHKKSNIIEVQIKSTALNILTHVMNCYKNLTLLNEHLKTTFAKELCLDIYEQSMVGDMKAVHSAAPILEQYIRKEVQHISKIKDNSLKSTITSRYSSRISESMQKYLESYQCGQILDLIGSLPTIFEGPKVRKALQTRIFQHCQSQNIEQQYMSVLFALDTEKSNHDEFGIKEQLKEIMSCLTNRQILGYCGYCLNLCQISSYNSVDVNKHLKQIIVTIMHRISSMVESPVYLQSSFLEKISTFIWRILRAMQSKVSESQNKKQKPFFIDYVRDLTPFIFHPYHMIISNPHYQKQYETSFQLILSASEYLKQAQFLKAFQVKNFKIILLKYINSTIQHIPYYMNLLYALQLYLILQNRQKPQQKPEEGFNNQKILCEILSEINSVIYRGIQTSKLSIQNIKRDLNVISVLLFLQVSIDHRVLRQHEKITGKDNSFVYKLILQHNLFNNGKTSIKYKNDTNILNYESLLLNNTLLLEENDRNILKMIQPLQQLALSPSPHYLQFTSLCSCFYKILLNYGKNDGYKKEQSCQIIFTFLKSLFENDNEDMERFMYTNAWGCNLLSQLIYHSQNLPIFGEILAWAVEKFFISNKMVGILGGLMQQYVKTSSNPRNNIKWPFAKQEFSKMGLLQKQLLLSLLKVYSDLMIMNRTVGCIQKIKSMRQSRRSGQSPWNRNEKKFTIFCNAIVENLKVMSPISERVEQQQYSQSQRRFLTSRKAPPTTEYQDYLKQMPISYLYSTKSEEDEQVWKEMHPKCTNILDIVHSHFNKLIIERYLMMVHVCYCNQQVCVQDYAHRQLLDMIVYFVEELVGVSKNCKKYKDVMTKIDKYVWNNHRLSKDLYLLNYVEESICKQNQLLNEIIQIGLDCCIELKRALEMKKDFKDFMGKIQKVLQMMRSEKKGIFEFQMSKYLEDGLFISRSQIGGKSTFITTSFRRK